MHVPLIRTALTVLGLSLCSGLFAQEKLPTFSDLKEEQSIILRAYLVRAQDPYIVQSKAQLTDGASRSAKQNAFTAILLFGRAKFRIDQHPTRIEQGRGDWFGGRLSPAKKEELRKSLKEDIDPRFFALQKELEGLAAKFTAMGDSSVADALGAAVSGNLSRVQKIIVDQHFDIVPDAPGPLPPIDVPVVPPTDPVVRPTPPTPPNPWRKPTQNPPGVFTMGQPPYQFQGPVVYTENPPSIKVSTPPYPAPFTIMLDTELVNAAGVHFYQTRDPLGVWVIPPGIWIDGATLLPGPPPRIRYKDGTVGSIDDVHVGPDGKVTINVPGKGEVPVGPKGEFPPKDKPLEKLKDENGDEISDSDLQDGLLRKYLREKEGRIVSEQRLSIDKNPDGTPKGVTFGEKRLWKLRLNPGEQKSAGGGVQQKVALVDDGGSTAFTVTGWEVVSDEGRRGSVEPSSANPSEATITFPGNGNYTITAIGTTTGWDKGSKFRVSGKIPVFQ